MISKLMHAFALTEKGARDFIKSVIWCYIYNLTLMLPVAAIMAVIMYVLSAFDAGAAISGETLKYTLIAVAVLAVLYVIYYFHYGALYIAVYNESAKRRISLAEVLRKLPLSFFSKRDLSDLTATMITDCAMLDQMFSHYIPELFAAIGSVVTYGIIMFLCDWRMAIAVLWVVPAAVLLTYGTKQIQKKAGRENLEDKRAVTEKIAEGIDTVRELKSCNLEEKYLKELNEVLAKEEKSCLRTELTSGAIVTSSQAILKCGIATTILTGAELVSAGSLPFLYYIGFLFAASKLYDPLSLLLQNIAVIFMTRVRIDRMREILEQPVQTGAEEFKPENHDITFSHVGFAYNEQEGVLKDVSFTVREGEVTALVGPSGGGKTTATRLAARFWDADRGTITLGGTDVRTIDPEVLLKSYSIVFQDVVLFKDTIRENIRLGRKNATDEEVYAAARAANCDEFIKRLSDGYDTIIGENGSTLSGGERQRISIARALLKNAPVILLDEATASLDVENESTVQSAISRLCKGKTVLIIAHRMRTVENADKVVVLEDGIVSEQGTPEELIRNKGSFDRMVRLQKESASWTL